MLDRQEVGHIVPVCCCLQILSLDAATNVGPAELLDLHNEMCYNPRPNKKIILICLKPAAQVRPVRIASTQSTVQ
jgi:hypothetical protein